MDVKSGQFTFHIPQTACGFATLFRRHKYGIFWSSEEKGTGPICPDGPEGASHKLDLSRFSSYRLNLAIVTLLQILRKGVSPGHSVCNKMPSFQRATLFKEPCP